MDPNKIGQKNSDFFADIDQQKTESNFSCLTMIAIFAAIVIIILLIFSYFYLNK